MGAAFYSRSQSFEFQDLSEEESSKCLPRRRSGMGGVALGEYVGLEQIVQDFKAWLRGIGFCGYEWGEEHLHPHAGRGCIQRNLTLISIPRRNCPFIWVPGAVLLSPDLFYMLRL